MAAAYAYVESYRKYMESKENEFYKIAVALGKKYVIIFELEMKFLMIRKTILVFKMYTVNMCFLFLKHEHETDK